MLPVQSGDLSLTKIIQITAIINIKKNHCTSYVNRVLPANAPGTYLVDNKNGPGLWITAR